METEEDNKEEEPAERDADPAPHPDPQHTPSVRVSRSDARYPLAYDSNGNPIRLPPNAVAWRVRKGGGKRGRPKNVFDQGSGRQLEIELGASLDDLIATNVPPDRYLLYPIDTEGNIIPGIVAMTEVPDGDDEDSDEERGAEGLTVDSANPLVALCAKQHQLVESIVAEHKFMMSENAKALASAVSGYAPVRPPVTPPPAPIIVEHPQAAAPTDGASSIVDKLTNMKPEQMMQIAFMIKQVFDLMRAGFAAPGGAAVGGGVGGAP